LVGKKGLKFIPTEILLNLFPDNGRVYAKKERQKNKFKEDI
jgi:hypothetical protein